MRLERLILQNFRGFESLEISFDPTFTVILGGNMSGKTALLDAVAIALGPPLQYLAAPPHISGADIRTVVENVGGVATRKQRLPLRLAVKAKIAQEDVHWDWLQADGLPAILTDPRPVGARLFHLSNTAETIDLPAIAYYGIERTWETAGGPVEIRGVASRRSGYEGAFDVQSSHSTLAGWMRKQTLVQLQRGNGYVQPQLAAVVAAVSTCIDHVSRMWFDIEYDEIRIQLKSGDIQPFSVLSEGFRNATAMVADLAWRTAVLNPQHGVDAPKETEGVVLIDELDLHLHPAWQRRVVGDLQRTFPKIQFIVTTHSPQIVASVKRDQVRILKDNRLVNTPVFVEGRDSNEILEDVFGVPPRPDKVKDELEHLYHLLEDEKFDEARAHLASLEQRLGPDDSAMVRARWILDTEAPQPIEPAAAQS